MNTKEISKWVVGILAAMTLPLNAALPFSSSTPTTAATPTPAQPAPTPEVLPKGVEKFTVNTSSTANAEVAFYVRVPATYSRETPNRVLFCCADDGESALTAGNAFNGLADDRGWFVISAGFNQSAGAAAADSYYDPAGYSGKAVFDALAQVAQKYPVAGDTIMLQGNGGGGQFVQRFALLHPEKVMAVAVNSANGFVAPNENAVKIPWLVTNITSDTNAADSTAFVAQLREASVKPVVRSYGEMARKVVGQVDSGEVDTIDRDFLAFYDGMLRVKLGHRSRQHKARRAKGLIH